MDSLSHAKFCKKKSLKGIGPLREDFYHKIPYFDDLGGYLENYDCEIWHEEVDLVHLLNPDPRLNF